MACASLSVSRIEEVGPEIDVPADAVRLDLEGRTVYPGIVDVATSPTIARLEGQEGFKAMAKRFPRFYLENDDVEYQPSIAFRSLKSLPVRWD